MPRDVATQWNSTYEMLKFALDYKSIINTLTADRDLKLKKFELSDEDWDVAEQLRDCLKVCGYSDCSRDTTTDSYG